LSVCSSIRVFDGSRRRRSIPLVRLYRWIFVVPENRRRLNGRLDGTRWR
jgi:hypothetical protein